MRHNATAALALAGREPRHVGVQIGHAHHQRNEHADHADQADKNGARQEKQFHRNQRHPHHEDADPLDAGHPGDVAAEEVQHQRRDADRAEHTEAGCLELDVQADDADEQQDRADGVDPCAQFLHAERRDIDPLRPGGEQLEDERVDALDRAGGEQSRIGLAVLRLGLKVGQREDVTLFADNFAIALEFFGLVHHRLNHIDGVAVFLSLSADLGADGRVHFHLHR